MTPSYGSSTLQPASPSKEHTVEKMKKFLVRVFTVIGVVASVSMALGGFAVWETMNHPQPSPKAPDTMVLTLDFTRPIVEQEHGVSPFSLAGLTENDEETSLLTILRALDRAKDDPRVKGVVARFGATPPHLVHAQEIRAALAPFRANGKFSYAYAPSYGEFGQGNRSYYLASAFEAIWVQPVGTVGLTGLGIEAPFGKSALGAFGVSTDFMRREEYKAVMENVSRDQFSPPVRANMEAMLANLAEQERRGIAESRKITQDKAREEFNNGPYTAPEALRLLLVTRIGYDDDMLKEAKDKAGKDAALVEAAAYLAFPTHDKEPKATLALITAEGLIADTPPSGPARQLANDHVIDTDQIVSAFKDAANAKDVKAILFRVDSPGGAPSASETIRHALDKAKAAGKPVFVSMGEVAASGGYWISMDADRIIADPATITGSIGVVVGKFVLGDLWKKLGVHWDSIITSDNAKMWSTLAPFTPHERERINALLDDTYNTFTANVAAARHIPPEKMPVLAKGRVWTGDQAVKIGLVDELGGIDATLAALKKYLKLDPADTVAVQIFPAPETPRAMILRLLHTFGVESAMLQSALGSWQKVQTLAAPVWDDMDTNVVTARVPVAALRAVQ